MQVLARSRVDGLDVDGIGRVTAVRYTELDSKASRTLDGLDAVVLAVGARGLRGIMSGSAALAAAAPALTTAAALGSVDVLTTRLWLDRRVEAPHPANVLSRFPQLRGACGTFFMLDQLQARRCHREGRAQRVLACAALAA